VASTAPLVEALDGIGSRPGTRSTIRSAASSSARQAETVDRLLERAGRWAGGQEAPSQGGGDRGGGRQVLEDEVSRRRSRSTADRGSAPPTSASRRAEPWGRAGGRPTGRGGSSQLPLSRAAAHGWGSLSWCRLTPAAGARAAAPPRQRRWQSGGCRRSSWWQCSSAARQAGPAAAPSAAARAGVPASMATRSRYSAGWRDPRTACGRHAPQHVRSMTAGAPRCHRLLTGATPPPRSVSSAGGSRGRRRSVPPVR
jgi:hypothetical protein